MKDSPDLIHQSIIDLYMQIKIRNQKEIESFNKGKENMEKEKLMKSSSLILLDYIKSSIEILVNIKVQEQMDLKKVRSTSDNNLLSTNEEESSKEYEKLLWQLESEIRNHIKIEHQMKLHNESLQNKIEELEVLNDKLINKNNALKEKKSIDKQDSTIESLKNEISHLKSKLTSEDKLNMEFEKKIKILNLNFEIEIRKLEEKYNENIQVLNQKINDYEQRLKDHEKQPFTISKIEEKKHLVRNNSASFIDRKDIKPLKSDIKVLEILNFKSKIDKEIENSNNFNNNLISRTQRRQNDSSLASNNQSKSSIYKQMNSHRAKTSEMTQSVSVSNSLNFNKNSINNMQNVLNTIKNINNNSKSSSSNNFLKNSLPIDVLTKMNQNGFKSNEINLKQFIYNKATKAKSLSKISSGPKNKV